MAFPSRSLRQERCSSVITRAEKVGEDYVINGNKVMISNGTEAKFLLVYCLTDPEGPPNQNATVSFSLKPIDRDIRRTKSSEDGPHASDTANIYFNNVKVPKENLVGVEGNGFVN